MPIRGCSFFKHSISSTAYKLLYLASPLTHSPQCNNRGVWVILVVNTTSKDMIEIESGPSAMKHSFISLCDSRGLCKNREKTLSYPQGAIILSHLSWILDTRWVLQHQLFSSPSFPTALVSWLTLQLFQKRSHGLNNHRSIFQPRGGSWERYSELRSERYTEGEKFSWSLSTAVSFVFQLPVPKSSRHTIVPIIRVWSRFHFSPSRLSAVTLSVRQCPSNITWPITWGQPIE